MDDDSICTLVIDNGSETIKAGFAGDSAPLDIFPSVFGKPRVTNIMMGMGSRNSYVGDEAESKRNVLILHNPIERGIVTNWDMMETIWHSTFYNTLRCAPEEHPILLSESPTNPKTHREKTTQIMFETFSPPAMYLANQATLSLYSTGKSSGLVVESGHGSSHVVPIYEGHAIQNGNLELAVAGGDLTNYLVSLLKEKGGESSSKLFESVLSRKEVHKMKEKHGYVALDVQKELDLSRFSCSMTREFELPDGQVISMDNERFQCSEPLFQPSLLGKGTSGEGEGLHQMVYRSMMNVSDGEGLGLRKQLSENIVLCGGSTRFPGFVERLEKEFNQMEELSTMTTRVNLSRPHSTWVGGSIWGSLSESMNCFISKEEYDESGPAVVHRKCY